MWINPFTDPQAKGSVEVNPIVILDLRVSSAKLTTSKQARKVADMVWAQEQTTEWLHLPPDKGSKSMASKV